MKKTLPFFLMCLLSYHISNAQLTNYMVDIPPSIFNVAVSKDSVYATRRDNNLNWFLHSYDKRDSSVAPKIKPLSVAVTSMKIINDYLYLVDYYGSIIRQKISKPEGFEQVIYIKSGIVDFDIKGNDIYVVNYSDRTIVKADLSDANPSSTITTVLNKDDVVDQPRGLQFYGDDLYFLKSSSGILSKVNISQLPYTVVDVNSGYNSPYAILKNGDNLFISESAYSEAKVFKVNLNTLVKEEIITGLSFVTGLATDGIDLYLSRNENSFSSISKFMTSDLKQYTYVPDDNFEQVLIDLGYDDVLDDYVKTENISSVTSLQLGFTNKIIKDFTGLEDFISIEDLNVDGHKITQIDVSNNTALKKLSVQETDLTSIDLSNNILLEKLNAYNTEIVNLDLTNNIALVEIVMHEAYLETINLSKCSLLEKAIFDGSNLKTIDVSSNIKLTHLSVMDNPVSDLDVSKNVLLTYLNVGYTPLTFLNLSNNSALINLRANNCSSLANLNLKNGTNTNITYFNVSNTPNLTCVQVDDAVYSTHNWTNKDAATTYSENCGGVKNTFATNASGNWNEATNWSLGHIPTQGEEVEIPSTSTVIVLQNTFYEVKKITNQGVLHLYGKLTVTDEFINTGRLMYNAVGSLLASKTSGVGAFVFTKNSYKGNALDPAKWYLFSLPSSGIIVQEVIANSTLATGTGTNKGLATYNNSYTGSTGWNYFNSLSQDLLSQGQGVAVKMMASSSMYLRKIQENVDAALLLSNYTIGTNKGTKNGWNLMGNPYLASIPVNSATNKADNFLAINGAKLDPAYAALYFWNPDTNSYDVVNNTTSEKYITPMEGFFVKTSTDVSNVDYKSVSLVHLPNNYAGRKLDSLTEIALRLELKEKKQKTIIKYLDDATDGLDVGYDAGVFNADKTEVSIYTNLVAEGNGTHFAIQCLPKDKIENSIIPIGIEATVGEEFTIKVEANQLPVNVKVLLEDKKTNTFTDLTDETAAYTITLKEKENNKNRFYLHTRAESLSNDEVFQTDVTILKTEEKLIQLKGLKNEGEVYIYNIQGKLVKQSKVNQHKNKVNIPTLAKGVYIVNLKTNDKQITQKIIL